MTYHHTFTECLLHIRVLCLANNGKCEFEGCSGTLGCYQAVTNYHWLLRVYPAIIFKVFFEKRITGGFYSVDDTERTKHQSRSGADSGDVASFYVVFQNSR